MPKSDQKWFFKNLFSSSTTFLCHFLKFDWILSSFQAYDRVAPSRQKWTFSTLAFLRSQSRFQSYQSSSRYLRCVRRRCYYRKSRTEMVFRLQEGNSPRTCAVKKRTDWTISSKKIRANPLGSFPSRRDTLMIPFPVIFTRWLRLKKHALNKKINSMLPVCSLNIRTHSWAQTGISLSHSYQQ